MVMFQELHKDFKGIPLVLVDASTLRNRGATAGLGSEMLLVSCLWAAGNQGLP